MENVWGMGQRGIAYRRKQEARVYNKRRNFWKAISDVTGFTYTRPRNSCFKKSEPRWLKKLRNGDITVGYMCRSSKTYSNRIYRKYSKLVTWKLPQKVFLKRKHLGHEGLQELWMV